MQPFLEWEHTVYAGGLAKLVVDPEESAYLFLSYRWEGLPYNHYRPYRYGINTIQAGLGINF